MLHIARGPTLPTCVGIYLHVEKGCTAFHTASHVTKVEALVVTIYLDLPSALRPSEQRGSSQWHARPGNPIEVGLVLVDFWPKSGPTSEKLVLSVVLFLKPTDSF